MDRLDLRDHGEILDHQVQQVQLDHQVKVGQLVLPVLQDHPVQKETVDQMEIQDNRVQWE
jgi:hypothetical protein